jgi:hypothetical protein
VIVENSSSESGDGSARQLNYFNYFTEVEEEFVRRRGKPLTISPLDWALVESWKRAGIPLHLVLRSINEAFDGYDKRPHNRRKVNTMFYCEQAVESNFADYRQAQVGGASGQTPQPSDSTPERPTKETSGAFSKSVLLDFIARCSRDISEAAAHSFGKVGIQEALTRALARLAEIAQEIESATRVDAEGIERDLDSIDRMILDTLKSELGEQVIAELRNAAKTQLRSYKKNMEKEIFEQTVENFTARRLRETNHIPRLSLFYI